MKYSNDKTHELEQLLEFLLWETNHRKLFIQYLIIIYRIYMFNMKKIQQYKLFIDNPLLFWNSSVKDRLPVVRFPVIHDDESQVASSLKRVTHFEVRRVFVLYQLDSYWIGIWRRRGRWPGGRLSGCCDSGSGGRRCSGRSRGWRWCVSRGLHMQRRAVIRTSYWPGFDVVQGNTVSRSDGNFHAEWINYDLSNDLQWQVRKEASLFL